MRKTNFAIKMYCAKYAKKLGVELYLIGYYYNSKKDVATVLVTKDELLEMCNLAFEELSPANKAYKIDVLGKKKKNVTNKKHIRLNASAKMLKNFHIAQLGGQEPELIPAEEFEGAREYMLTVKNQKNRGYALEYCIQGEDWDEHHRGIDIEDEHIEIKFANGQIEL